MQRKIVEKALRNDSFISEELLDYNHLKGYKQGGIDNTTAAVCINNKEDIEEFEK